MEAINQQPIKTQGLPTRALWLESSAHKNLQSFYTLFFHH